MACRVRGEPMKLNVVGGAQEMPKREKSALLIEGGLPKLWLPSPDPLEIAIGAGVVSIEGHLAQSRAASGGGFQKTLFGFGRSGTGRFF